MNTTVYLVFYSNRFSQFCGNFHMVCKDWGHALDVANAAKEEFSDSEVYVQIRIYDTKKITATHTGFISEVYVYPKGRIGSTAHIYPKYVTVPMVDEQATFGKHNPNFKSAKNLQA